MKSDDGEEVEVFLHFQTDAAILVSLKGEKKFAVWLPKSKVEGDFKSCGKAITISAPEWLLQREGLI